jgi:hypothetical protein
MASRACNYQAVPKQSFETTKQPSSYVPTGRAIGAATEGQSMQTRALVTLEYFKTSGLWTANAVTNEKGVTTGYTISQTKLTDAQYNNALKTLQSTNNNGYTPTQQAGRDAEIKQNAADGEKLQKQINSKMGPKQ